MSFPPRTSSAPLNPAIAGGGKFHPAMGANLPGAPPRTFAANAHVGVHGHHVPHHQHQQQPHFQNPFARVPAAASAVPGFMSRAAEPVAVATVAAASAPPASAAAVESSPAASPTTGAASSVAATLTPEQEFPPNCVYEAAVFLRLRTMTADLPDAVRKFGMEMWSKVQDVTSRPEHMQVTRDDLFSGSAAAPQSRLIAERHLHHQVRGILARVTPEKYDSLKDELLQLPIRQSDEEDVKLVVSTFFTKAIRPEDAPYAKYYVRLISDMIQYIGPKEEAAKMIRKEIVTQCQATFENIDTLLSDPEAGGDGDIDPDELEILRKMAKDKNKANINLLGYLFVNGLVPERVITNVLYSLLYGPGGDTRRKHRHVPADFEIEMFIELMLNTGKSWTEITNRFLKTFVASMTDLSKTHPSKRIQFKLMNTLEIIENGFEQKKSKGPLKLSEFDEALQRNKAAMQSAVDVNLRKQAAAAAAVAQPSGAAASPTAKPLPSKREVHEALDSGNAEDAVVLLKEIPEQSKRMEYCTEWLHRPMTVVRLNDQRDRIGATFASLTQAKLFSGDEVREIMKNHVRKIIADGEYLEMPRYFSHFVSVIKFGEGVLTTDLLTYLLRAVVEDENADVATIHRLIGEVQKQQPQCLEPHSSHRRFRVLPTLLMQRPSFARPDSDELESADVLDELEMVETVLYQKLYNGESAAGLQQWINKQADRGDVAFSTKSICACFCFARFDPSFACGREIKDIVKKLLSFSAPSARPTVEASWLSELYETWKDLDRIPSDGFQSFVKWLHESQHVSTASIERFAAELAKSDKESSGDVQRLRMLLSR